MFLLLLFVAVSLAYSSSQSDALVGSWVWTESGLYANLTQPGRQSTLKRSYSGVFCLCEAEATPEGIFAEGAGVNGQGDKIATFLGVFSQSASSDWIGQMAGFGGPAGKGNCH